MDKQRIAIYPGTFDPITKGHLDILKRGCDLFDKVIVAIAQNPAKDELFGLQDRVDMIREALVEHNLNYCVDVDVLEGLSVEGARKNGAVALIRGLRAVSDFEYEFQMALMNRHLAPELHTVYLMPKAEYVYLSSTIIKGVARHGGDVDKFLPAGVRKRLIEKYGKTQK